MRNPIDMQINICLLEIKARPLDSGGSRIARPQATAIHIRKWQLSRVLDVISWYHIAVSGPSCELQFTHTHPGKPCRQWTYILDEKTAKRLLQPLYPDGARHLAQNFAKRLLRQSKALRRSFPQTGLYSVQITGLPG